MRVVGADKMDAIAAQALITHPDIGLDMFQHMTEVNGAVCVRQGTGNQNFTSCVGHSSCLYQKMEWNGHVTRRDVYLPRRIVRSNGIGCFSPPDSVLNLVGQVAKPY
jgi:hypothetical protein